VRLATTVLAFLEISTNRALRFDPAALERLARLNNKVIKIHVLGLDLPLFVIAGADGLRILGDYDDDVDTVIQGAPFSLLSLLWDQDRLSVHRGDVRIDGDLELGQRFQNILRDLDIDWEEILSKVVGDVGAHQAANVASDIFHWIKQTTESFLLDSAEYITEERRDLPSLYEVQQFLQEVDEVQAAADRIAQRVTRLANHPGLAS